MSLSRKLNQGWCIQSIFPTSPNAFLINTTLDSHSIYLSSKINLALSRPWIVFMVASVDSEDSFSYIPNGGVDIQLVIDHTRVYFRHFV